MANVDFSKNKDGSGSAAVETVQTVETPAGDKVECPNTHTGPGADVFHPESPGLPARRADVFSETLPTMADIILPRINLVADVGLLKDSFRPGTYVFDQRVILYTPTIINAKTHTVTEQGTPPLIITVLKFKPTRFVEKVAGGGRGLICHTEDEVRRAGGTLDYQEFKLKEKSGMRRFDYMAEAFIAIERPEAVADDETVFVYEVDGKKYALGLYAMKASAHTVAKRALFTPRTMGYLKGGYETWSVALSSEQVPSPDKSTLYWRPVIVPNKKSTPAFLEWAKSIFAAPVVESPDNGE